MKVSLVHEFIPVHHGIFCLYLCGVQIQWTCDRAVNFSLQYDSARVAFEENLMDTSFKQQKNKKPTPELSVKDAL